MLTKLLAASLIGITLTGTAFAQDSSQSKQKKEERIIITKKGTGDQKMTVVVDGDKVTGTIQAQGEAIPIDNVKMNGTEITFDASEDDGTVMIHTGKYYADGDSIAMNLNYQGMRLHATLKRADK